jgi:hypothetical protein
MAITNTLLYKQFFTGNTITVTHNLNRLDLNYRVICSGTSRPDLVQNITFSSDERNSFIIDLNSYNLGTIQVLDSDVYSLNLPSPENNLKLVDILENQFLLDIYQSGTTTLNETTYTSIPWDAQIIVGSNYTHTIGNSNIRIESTGTYQITYSISIDISSNNRTISRARLSLNGIEIPRSGGFGYHRTSAHGENTISKTIIVPMVITDVITLDAIKYTTPGGSNILSTISNDSNITITKLNNG